MTRILSRYRLSRFIVVGIVNTVTGFALLNFAYYVLHLGEIYSSIFSTSCAVALSFFLNRNFVFQNSQKTIHDQFIKFAIISLTGSFVMTNGVYIACVTVLRRVPGDLNKLINWLPAIQVDNDFVIINLSLVAGVLAAMTWNYLGYKNFVFKVVDESETK